MILKKGVYFAIFLSLTGCSYEEGTKLANPHSESGVEKEEDTPLETSISNDEPSLEITVPPKEDLNSNKGSTDVLSNLETSITHEQISTDNHLYFQIKNTSEHSFTFHFETTQQYLYKIYKEDGEIVEEQDNSIMKKIPSTYFLKPGGSVNYKVSTKKLSTGTYKVIFTFLSKEKTIKKSFNFTVK